MKRTLTHIRHSVCLLGSLLLVLLAIVLSVGRLLTPLVSEQRTSIQQWASTVLERPVQVDSLNVSWDNFSPVLRCTQVTIFDKSLQHPLFKVAELDISFNIWKTILSGRLQLDHLTMSGVHLVVRQTPAGKIIVYGLGTLPAKGSQPLGTGVDELVEWLLAQPELSLEDISLNWYTTSGHLLPINNFNVSLVNGLYQHYLRGQAELQQRIPSQLKFIANITGNWQTKTNLTAHWYVKGQQLLLGQWLQANTPNNINITHGLANLEVWGNWDHGHISQAQSLITVRQVKILLPNNSIPFDLVDGKANILWQNTGEGSWQADAQVQELSTKRWQKIPGVSNLSGFLHVTPNNGLWHCASNAVSLDFGKLFRYPLQLQQLNGVFTWQHIGQDWQVQLTQLLAKSEDATLTGTAGVYVPHDPSSPVLLSILAGFHLRGVKHIPDYLPLTILPPDLVQWLDQAIVQANDVQSTVILRGPIADFPFDNNTGTFIVDSQVQGVQLNYKDNWPAVENLAGHLVFSGRSMQMMPTAGTIVGIPVSTMSATIPLMKKHVPTLLAITGSTITDLANGLQFLQQCPLKNSFKLPDGLQVTGPMQLELHLSIPLEHGQNPQVAGTINATKAQLNVPSWHLQLTQVAGQLSFTQNTFTASKLTALLWDKPIQASINTVQQTPQITINYEDLLAKAVKQPNSWNLTLQSPSLAGQIQIPTASDQIIQGQFQRLYLTPNPNQSLPQIDPRQLPAFNLGCNDFRYDNKLLGQVQLQVRKQANGIQITQLNVNAANFKVAAIGNWRQQKQSALSQLSGQITSTNIAAALANWGFPASITAKQSSFKFNLSWPGVIYAPHLTNLNGTLQLNLQNGQITNLSTASKVKMDIGRLLSLLSFQSIERRLKLDFSDLTAKGFSFDSFQGDWQLQNGNATTQNTLMKGTVAQVAVTGRIGLVAEDYNLLVKITPQVTSSLPLIVGLASGPLGPITGTATWVASKLFSSEVNKITSDTYQMTGPWASPNIVQVGGFWKKPAAGQ